MTQINEDLKLESYFYELPRHLIADQQLEHRHDSKLMVYKKKSNQVIHSTFKNLATFLNTQNLLVLNESKVFPCRLIGQKKTGAKAEIFILEYKSDTGFYNALIKSAKKKKIGDEYFLDESIKVKIEQINSDQTFKVSFNVDKVEEVLDQFGKIPIPPYIRKGESNACDVKNYQTIYAKNKGSVAAPTAGLHFTPEVFKALKLKNIEHALVTLHVGLGTFLPVKTPVINEHKMHFENYFIDKENLEKINSNKDIIAVGTTSLRVLESLQIENFVADTVYQTDIFLYPGKRINKVKGLLTNFHLPQSSLLMLVSCLIGRQKVLDLYGEAIKHAYRFYSYGDAMLILLEE